MRDICVFAQQNITADPPFSHVDMIACRNVLIYMSPALQQRVLPIFHYALTVPGYLVLGTSETVGQLGNYFDIVDRAAKIYVKRSEAPFVAQLPGAAFSRMRDAAPAAQGHAPSIGDFHAETNRLLLGRYAPPGVLIDENLNILEFRGRTARYLEIPAGQPTTSLLKLAQDGLILELRNALNEAKAANGPVERRDVHVRAGGVSRSVDLEITPIAVAGARYRCYLVLFHDAEAPPPGAFYRGADGGLAQKFSAWFGRWWSRPSERPTASDGNATEMERLQHVRLVVPLAFAGFHPLRLAE